MADEPEAPTNTIDRPHAPVVYFEESPKCAYKSGLISVTLSFDLHVPAEKGGTRIDKIIVAYLKTNVAGARTLRDLLDKAILVASPPETTSKN